MTDEDMTVLADVIAGELQDSAGIATEDDRALTARVIAGRIEWTLYRMGWRPPSAYEHVQDWAERTRNIPDHHVSRSVLTSHLAELAQILNDR